jgi:hypothetical protein
METLHISGLGMGSPCFQCAGVSRDGVQQLIEIEGLG